MQVRALNQISNLKENIQYVKRLPLRKPFLWIILIGRGKNRRKSFNNDVYSINLT